MTFIKDNVAFRARRKIALSESIKFRLKNSEETREFERWVSRDFLRWPAKSLVATNGGMAWLNAPSDGNGERGWALLVVIGTTFGGIAMVRSNLVKLIKNHQTAIQRIRI